MLHHRSDSSIDRATFLRASGLFVAGALGVGGLAACGSEEATTAATGTGATTGTRPLKKASIQLKWVLQNQFAGELMAREKGFYADAGLDVDIRPGGPDIQPERDAATGAADIAIGFMSTALANREQGAPVVNISQLHQRGTAGIIAFKDRGIDSVERMKDKSFSTFLGGGQFPYFADLSLHGLDPASDVDVVNQGVNMQVFLQRKVDVASAGVYSELLQVYESGVRPSDVWFWKVGDDGINFLEDGYYTSQDNLDDPDKRETLVGLVKAGLRGWDYAFNNVDETSEVVFRLAGDGAVSLAHQREQLRVIRDDLVLQGATLTHGIGYMDPTVLDDMYSLCRRYGVLRKDQDLDAAYSHDIWQAAVASLRADGLQFRQGRLVRAA
ncbi:ABC transporter substrate-binding protein [Conexibacter sp. CPCC 206217]|uniref:ABC transporter substrate-binding protein n=1 Tax=Conexibacter sp. CPCC 206217 TaxID=3064574 RepID=UPI00271DD665|nr:ABC transporter substrate-binding protein [Conexibacter sp. CPCC 206217]MDO8210166.1 ABC transporter substrate-binding protein [Conexibacter sp. CPCC 206217]